jgi:hypothetical protein
MLDSTPYRLRPPDEVRREQDCMRRIFENAPRVPLIWEAFGGTGITAQVLSDRFPGAQLQATELDAECVLAYNSLGLHNALCRQVDAREFAATCLNGHRVWGVSLDFNRLTLLDLWGRPEGRWKVDLISTVVQRATQLRWLQVTDSAASHLHLNFDKYGLQAPSIPDYVARWKVEAFARWKLTLSAWAGHSRATYMLLVP